MSAGFNFGQPSGGFSFPAQKTTASAPAAAGGGFSFGTAGQATTNPTGSFSFGTQPKSSATSTGFSFGNQTTGFGLGATPQTTAATTLTLGSLLAPSSGGGFTLGGGLSSQITASAPAGGGFSFGAAQTQAAAAPTATPSAATTAAAGSAPFGGFSFGTNKIQVTTAAASTAPAPAAGGGGGFSFGTTTASTSTAATTQSGAGFGFGIKPSSTPAPPAYTQAASSAPSGPSLFASPITSAASAPATTAGFMLGSTPASIASTAIPAAAGGGLNFPLKPLGSVASSTAAASSATTAPAATTGPAVGFSLGLKPLSSTTMTATATATTLTTATAPPVMTYAQLESLINKWSLELEDQERHFLQQATQVNAWDRMLVENGEKITSLHKELEKVKLDQRRLNQELDFILSQQKELEDVLSPLEESVKEQSGTIYMQNADEERERTYKLAENVDAQLKRMSHDLKEIIEHLNTSSGPADTSDPLQQICKILNAHMDSLQWIDQNSVLLQRRVEEVSKLCDTQRKEQEKTFRLTFD
ncbi:nucleoporin 62 like [Cyprinodon tularosa]|uniref:nucleoporin 62 like n=1 Tax=Cyprinodon tularosa TaxID=77115 RepID=UPI0018E26895|nr:nucleoporin 62 like [Cyprinodon tularosa]